jgi:hypothetical protein
MRIQAGSEHHLLQEEQDVDQRLLCPNGPGIASGDDKDLTQRTVKRRRMQDSSVSSSIDTRFLIPTSNHVERLFSMSKRIFSTKRGRLLPRTLEALVFLKQNRMLWNMDGPDVN